MSSVYASLSPVGLSFLVLVCCATAKICGKMAHLNCRALSCKMQRVIETKKWKKQQGKFPTPWKKTGR
jgi:hypothetical protein